MRIYDGSPRQDFEEVFRSIGAFLDSRGMRDILVVEVPDGFVVQGLVAGTDASSAWSESVGSLTKETLSFFDDDIAKFMEEAAARRGGEQPGATEAGAHERALRVIGHWIDSQKPKDVFLFEQDGAYVVRLLRGRTGRRAPHDQRVHARGHRRPDRSGARPARPAEAGPDRRAAARGRRARARGARGGTGRCRRRRAAGASPPADRRSTP